jgi:hypothetical protein
MVLVVSFTVFLLSICVIYRGEIKNVHASLPRMNVNGIGNRPSNPSQQI